MPSPAFGGRLLTGWHVADETKAGFEVHFVERYDEVFKTALEYESSELPLAAAAS